MNSEWLNSIINFSIFAFERCIYKIVNKITIMARFIRKDATGPMEIKVGGESNGFVCVVGNNQPFCDGSHKKTSGEEPSKVYSYNKDGARTEVKL